MNEKSLVTQKKLDSEGRKRGRALATREEIRGR
jgi:hypothetical protein